MKGIHLVPLVPPGPSISLGSPWVPLVPLVSLIPSVSPVPLVSEVPQLPLFPWVPRIPLGLLVPWVPSSCSSQYFSLVLWVLKIPTS